MKDADALIQVLIAVAHRWSPWADPAERKLRHRTDAETLATIQERALNWSLDLRRRGSSSRYWEKIAHSLRNVAVNGSIEYSGMPDGLLLQIMQQPKGEFVPDEELASASAELESAQRLLPQEGKCDNKGRMFYETHRLIRRSDRSQE